ncbi:hypothetical protein MMC19_005112 [Ptychographa xylographoides]|nr:hypothetical protein [Ptychographa xylographoides]
MDWTRSVVRALLGPTLSNTFQVITSSQLIEEETFEDYEAMFFYPTRLGETFKGKYHIVGKLGAGNYSTVWMARDKCRRKWQSNRFVALKIATNNPIDKVTTAHEEDISRHITKANPKHEGYGYVRHILDSFGITGPDGMHTCLVFELLREPLWMFKQRGVGTFPPLLLKLMSPFILQGLDYLHTECHVIHTDLKMENIMIKVESISIVYDYVKGETEDPCPRKLSDDRIIYLSRNDFGPFRGNPGTPTISDFGLAVWGDKGVLNHPIQPDCFRAPEVMLGAEWTYSVDIWNFGALLWELVEGTECLFCAKTDYTPASHMGEIIALLGPPPKALLEREGSRTSKFFTEDGTFRFPELTQKDFNFENLETVLEGDNKKLFIGLMRRMLQWLPENRPSAKELIDDPWIRSIGLDEWPSGIIKRR